MDNLLVPVDFSDITTAVIDRAARLAESFSSRLWLLHVAVPAHDPVPYNVDRRLLRFETARTLRNEHQRLQRQADRLRDDGIHAVARFIQGPVDKTILLEAERMTADLIIMGSHGHGSMYHALLGSISQNVLRKAPCPVMLVPSRAKGDTAWKEQPASAVAARKASSSFNRTQSRSGGAGLAN